MASKRYLNNKDLHIELIVSKAQGRLTRKGEEYLILICKGVNRKFYYTDPDDRFDCLQEGLHDVFKYWYNYNELKTTNAFAFITEIAKRAHTKGWNKLNKSREEISLNEFWSQDGDLNV